MFAKPWQIAHTGPGEYLILDANDRKLFYMTGDEGDSADKVEPTVLFYGSDEEHAALIQELAGCLTSKS